MHRALVIGVNGQDGSYLADYLAGGGHSVIGVARGDKAAFPPGHGSFEYVIGDLTKPHALAEILKRHQPDRIFHFAAVHGPAGFQYEDKFHQALLVNTNSVHECLEYIRTQNAGARLLYASSLKAFGTDVPALVNENSVRRSECLYSVTKNAATDLITYYRDAHGVRASVVYLSNHESPRRPAHFFFPRIVAALAAALRGSSDVTSIRTLDFACDWGSARDFVQLGAAILEREENEDFVIATGRTWTGQEFVETIFSAAGLEWQKYLRIESPVVGTASVYQLDISKLITALGHGSATTAPELASWILRENHGIDIRLDPVPA